ncbi:MAG: hypothetical protein JNM02_04210 [Anaerolineales bacterium]|nr:hypothetical protein [Anaerolineales bacterium]
MFEDVVPALKEFFAVIGLDPQRLPDYEGFHKLSVQIYRLPAAQAAKFDLRHFTRIAQVFTGCFTCQFILHQDDLEPPEENPVILSIPPVPSQADLDRFHERIEEVNSVEFSFQLDKRKLLERQGISAPNTNFFLYLFPVALTRFLSGATLTGEPCSAYDSLKMFEENLWHGMPNEVDEKAVILVLGHDIQLNGDHFALLGGTYLIHWQAAAATDGVPAAQSNSIYEICRANIFWDNRWVTRLTPPKLKINDGVWKQDDPMVSALQIQLFNLIVLFTASRVAGSGEDWIATYASSLGIGDVTLYAPARLPLEPRLSADVNSFYEIFSWAYFSQWTRDHIAFVQGTLAEELTHNPLEDARKVLLERAKMLKASLDVRWDNFIREKLQAYSKEEQALESAVVEIIDAFGERVTAMGKSVSDAMLTAVAALLGSFVAAGFGSERFNPFIFRVGMLVYSGYVLIFPFLYNMIAQWRQYNMLKGGILGRMERLRQKLSMERMNEIAGRWFEQSDRNFQLWFWLTTAIYIFVILLGFAAAFIVPKLIGG